MIELSTKSKKEENSTVSSFRGISTHHLKIIQRVSLKILHLSLAKMEVAFSVLKNVQVRFENLVLGLQQVTTQKIVRRTMTSLQEKEVGCTIISRLHLFRKTSACWGVCSGVAAGIVVDIQLKLIRVKAAFYNGIVAWEAQIARLWSQPLSKTTC